VFSNALRLVFEMGGVVVCRYNVHSNLAIACKARRGDYVLDRKVDEQMKALQLVVVGAIVCANAVLLPRCRAADNTGKATATEKATVVASTSGSQTNHSSATRKLGAAETKAICLTGSNIPQKVKKAGRITKGTLNVTVIDQSEIGKSGAATLAQVLARDPGVSTRGW
jgi:hypothetical protein